VSSANYRTFSSYYFEEAFRNTDLLIERATRKLQDVPFDTLVGTGVSGTIFVPILARALDKHWMIVRKEWSEHAKSMLEGELGCRWLFCDDFIDTGATLKRVRQTIKDYNPCWHTVFGGSYLYRDNSFKPARKPHTQVEQGSDATASPLTLLDD